MTVDVCLCSSWTIYGSSGTCIYAHSQELEISTYTVDVFSCRPYTSMEAISQDISYKMRVTECGLTTLHTRRLTGDQNY